MVDGGKNGDYFFITFHYAGWFGWLIGILEVLAMAYFF